MTILKRKNRHIPKSEFCVIGIDNFGRNVIRGLVENNKTVIAIDKDEWKINKVAPYVDVAVKADATNAESLKNIGGFNVDTVIVSIGNDIESSVLCITTLMEHKVKNIIARASSSRHARILNSLGVSLVVFPERDSGKETAIKAIFGVDEELSLITPNHTVTKLTLLNPEFSQIKIVDLNWRKQYGINIIGFRRDDIFHIPKASDKLEINDEIIFICKNTCLPRARQLLQDV